MNLARPANFQKARDDGFTFVELLVVVAVVAILFLLLLPAVAGTKPNSQVSQCLGSLRQLTLGWQMYSADNNGWLAPNGDESSQPASLAAAQAGANAQWCPGRQDLATQLSPAGTPTASNLGDEWIASGVIFPYVKSPLIYHCPADNSSLTQFGAVYPRVRSRSMNGWLAPAIPYNTSSQPQSFYKESSLVNPRPANLFVFIDESSASINDGSFICVPQSADWYDCPASYHNGAGGLAFADGHALMKKWTDPAVLSGASSWTSGVAGSGTYGDLNYLEGVSSTVAP